MQDLIQHFKDTVLNGFQLKKVHITLNPDTAHARLILSDDCKRARWQPSIRSLPSNPERFDVCHYVLGYEEFTTGRHFWTVSLGSEGEWFVGVARKTVERKGYVGIKPEAGIWGVGKWANEYWAATQDHYSPLTLTGQLRVIQVYLNYEGGRVSFYDGERKHWVYVFSGTSWAGETLVPFFRVFANAYLNTGY